MATSPYKKYGQAISKGESDYRSRLANVLNMAGPSQQIGQATGGGTTLNFADVPSVANLANMQAVQSGQSISRENVGGKLIKSLPDYEKSYRQYLRWRYPTRYGSGSGSTYNYGPTGSGMVNVPSISGDIVAPPGSGL